MRIRLHFDQGVQENASAYYDQSKKARKKLEGLAKATRVSAAKRLANEREREADAAARKPVKKRKKDWFEKFHWFHTSEGFLVIAGRDAKGNEQVVKKHTDDKDVYFHADIVGAPHTVLKCAGKQVSALSKQEAAQFAGVFSKAWQNQQAYVDVYSVKPDQVSKKAPAGETLGTGAFMIYGKREWFKKTPLAFAIGVKKAPGEHLALIVVSGPESAVKGQALLYAKVSLGDDRKSEAAKKLRKLFEDRLAKDKVAGAVELDELIAMLPSDNLKVLLA